MRALLRSQRGYTLVEVVIASALGVVVMTALTSVVLTTWRANLAATQRVEAASEVLSFEEFARDDFAASAVPTTCDGSGVVLNTTVSDGSTRTVTYGLNGTFLDRQAGGVSRHVVDDVSSFLCQVDGASPNETIVVSISVTVGSYSESQVFRFYPRLQ